VYFVLFALFLEHCDIAGVNWASWRSPDL